MVAWAVMLQICNKMATPKRKVQCSMSNGQRRAKCQDLGSCLVRYADVFVIASPGRSPEALRRLKAWFY